MGNEKVFNVRRCSLFPGSEYLEVGWNMYKVKGKWINMITFIAKFTMSLLHFYHIVKNFTYSAFEKYH